MSDSVLVRALTVIRDKLVVALADVARGDHLRAAEALEEAEVAARDALAQMRDAA